MDGAGQGAMGKCGVNPSADLQGVHESSSNSQGFLVVMRQHDVVGIGVKSSPNLSRRAGTDAHRWLRASIPFTVRLTIMQQPGYQLYEYSCHEGNGAVSYAERA
jgi:hypothetical protein